jgi:hypothetical protein
MNRALLMLLDLNPAPVGSNGGPLDERGTVAFGSLG